MIWVRLNGLTFFYPRTLLVSYRYKPFRDVQFYLSSYKLGNQVDVLKKLCPKGKIAYIPNALDYRGVNIHRRQAHIEKDIFDLTSLNLETELLDLRHYFEGPSDDLKQKLLDIGAIFISGGNVFVLRQAMFLSKLDQILQNMDTPNFLYAGYSAAACVLSPTLRSYAIVDDSADLPYSAIDATIWSGLGLIPYQFLPHFDSDHPESADIDLEIEFCKENGWPYQAIRDGEVVIIDNLKRPQL